MTTAGRFVHCAVSVLVLGVALTQPARKANAEEDRRVEIINHASRPIYHLYISNVDEDRWGPDQLGLYETITPDHYRIFNVDDGTGHCRYDFKAVLSDGRYAVIHNLNVCTEGSWTVTD